MKGEPLQILLIVCLSIIGVCFAQSTYYVTPTPDIPCPGSEEPCQTLSEYIADGTFNNLPKNTTIRFLSGNHTLNTTIALENLTLLTVLGDSSSLPEVTSRIICTWPAGFACTDITGLHINALGFISCGHNHVGALNITSVEHSHISRCTFESNYAADNCSIGGAIAIWYSNLSLAGNIFQNNSAHTTGGARYVHDGKLALANNLFQDGWKKRKSYGGAIAAHGGTLAITTNTFKGNSAIYGGAVRVEEGIISLTNNTFLDNSAGYVGGSISAIGGTLNITTNTFQANSASQGGAVDAQNETLSITNNAFLGNFAKDDGGAISTGRGTLNFTSNTFLSNSAYKGAAVDAYSGILSITTNTFWNNSGGEGGVVNVQDGIFSINSNTFWNNTAKYAGGVIFIQAGSDVTLSTNTFQGNSALYGGAIIAFDSALCLISNIFLKNSAHLGGALLVISSSLALTGNAFIRNFALSSGGALAIYGSTVNLTATLNKNSACSVAGNVGHRLTQLDKVTIDSNAATYGGGMYVVLTSVYGNMILTGNSAIEGGALFAYRGRFSFNDITAIANNSATIGGGLLLSENSKLYLRSNTTIHLINNTADQTGGAIHVDNHIEFCFEKYYDITFYRFLSDCFFQIELNRKQPYAPKSAKQAQQIVQSLNISLHFENNNAKYAGSDLYGGPVEKCSLSSIKDRMYYSYSGLVFNIITNNESKPNITSDPLVFYICTDHGNVQGYSQSVYPGGTVKVPVIAFGQRNQTTIATVHVVDISNSITLQSSEYFQNINRGCNTLKYTIFSHAVGTTQKMTLDANGVCSLDHPVTVTLDILYCPPGFQLPQSRSHCTCDQRLLKYTNTCVVDNGTVLRPRNAEFWVGYNDDKGLILHSHCPFDYCTTEEMYLEVTHSDKQCNSDRSGLLCGKCSDNLSLVLGSSRCLQCSNSYLSLLAAFALAGITLVLFLLSLKLTVAAGTINGLIFYANVITMNSAIFFRPGTSNVLTLFIAWINLDLGIKSCFYNGMDAYSKTWLQFVFPVYVWGLVVVMIVGSNYSGRMAKILGRNPIAVLATLILLSYAKLLRTTIAALSYTRLDYPNSQIAVWLYDGNIGYLSSKHIPLFLVALACLLFFFLPYTTLLTVAQWLQVKSEWRVFSWIKNRYMFSFLDAYHAPYSSKRRYYIGAMLILRLVLFLISAVNVLGDPRINLLAVLAALTFITPTILAGTGVYKSRCLSVLDLSFLVNLIILVSITLYIYPDEANQNAVTFTSVSTVFATFIGIMIYHAIQQIKATQVWRKMFPRPQYVRVPLDDEDPPNRVYASGRAPTQTVVDICELRQERMHRAAENREMHEATVLWDPWEAGETHEPRNPIECQEPLTATY